MKAPLGSAFARFEVASRARGPSDDELHARALVELAERHDLGEEDAALAIELALSATRLSPEERRTLSVLALAVRAALSRGATRIPVEGTEGQAALAALGTMLASLLPERLAAEARVLPDRVARLLGDARVRPIVARDRDAYAPLVLVDGHLYAQRVLAAESRVARALSQRFPGSATPASGASEALADVAARPVVRDGVAVRLSDEQRAAVLACTRPSAVVSGGPGTGKTSIAVAILRVLVRLGVAPDALALAAPTGKAAFRLGESIASALATIADPAPEDRALREALSPAATLHRLLGYSPSRGTFASHEGDPLPARVVLVDEASMVDLVLMDRLLRALAPDARLVLFGDGDQLPSVEAGAVLRDLATGPGAEALGGACVRLTQSFRMDPSNPSGRAILEVARAVNAGELRLDRRDASGAPLVAARRRAADVVFDRVEHVDDGERRALLHRFYDERVASLPRFDAIVRRAHELSGTSLSAAGGAAELLAHLARSRVLTVTRVLPAGADAINELLHERAVLRLGAPRVRFAAGEPVLVLANDYERGLWNGDQGVVLWARAASRTSLVVAFPRETGLIAFPLDAIQRDLAHAYAMTVHKSQGSEHDDVAVVLPPEDVPIATRELLYTAITRARRSVVLVGSAWSLERAAARVTRRDSGLPEALALAAASTPRPT